MNPCSRRAWSYPLESLNRDLEVPKPECRSILQNFPTRKQNYAENIYTEGNHAARQIHHAARGCKSINCAARGIRITRRVIKSEAIFIFNQDFTPRVVQSYAARGQVREQSSSCTKVHAARGQLSRRAWSEWKSLLPVSSITRRVMGYAPSVVKIIHFLQFFLFSCKTSNQANG